MSEANGEEREVGSTRARRPGLNPKANIRPPVARTRGVGIRKARVEGAALSVRVTQNPPSHISDAYLGPTQYPPVNIGSISGIFEEWWVNRATNASLSFQKLSQMHSLHRSDQRNGCICICAKCNPVFLLSREIKTLPARPPIPEQHSKSSKLERRGNWSNTWKFVRRKELAICIRLQ